MVGEVRGGDHMLVLNSAERLATRMARVALARSHFLFVFGFGQIGSKGALCALSAPCPLDNKLLA